MFYINSATGNKKMTKKDLIPLIVQQLKISAIAHNDYNFCEGDTFFSLAFKTDEEVNKIAKLAGVI